jgi:hypothetical protein
MHAEKSKEEAMRDYVAKVKELYVAADVADATTVVLSTE